MDTVRYDKNYRAERRLKVPLNLFSQNLLNIPCKDLFTHRDKHTYVNAGVV